MDTLAQPRSEKARGSAADESRIRVLAVDDEPGMLRWIARTLEQQRYEVRTATTGASALDLCRFWEPAVVVADLVLPDLDGLRLLARIKASWPDVEVMMVTGHGSVPTAVEAMKAGAYSFVEKPLDPTSLLITLERAVEKRQLQSENRRLKRELGGRTAVPEIVGRSRAIEDLLRLIQVVGPTDANVLVVGESGTGKELVGNALHCASRRSAGPFVKINCAAIPKDLIESELFGHQRGAFTGAHENRQGLLGEANGGSLLLDEIGEMPAHLQAKLLRVLQEREYRPLGSSRTHKVDFRLICATNVDLDASLRDGRLRQDLFFRINTITVRVPALRDRTSDIPLLAEYFLEKFAARHKRPAQKLAPETVEAMTKYSWPGNVRELQNVVERAVLVSRRPEIGVDDLPEPFGAQVMGREPVDMPACTLAELERSAIAAALKRASGNKRAAAQQLGLYRQTLYAKMRKHGLG